MKKIKRLMANEQENPKFMQIDGETGADGGGSATDGNDTATDTNESGGDGADNDGADDAGNENISRLQAMLGDESGSDDDGADDDAQDDDAQGSDDDAQDDNESGTADGLKDTDPKTEIIIDGKKHTVGKIHAQLKTAGVKARAGEEALKFRDGAKQQVAVAEKKIEVLAQSVERVLAMSVGKKPDKAKYGDNKEAYFNALDAYNNRLENAREAIGIIKQSVDSATEGSAPTDEDIIGLKEYAMTFALSNGDDYVDLSSDEARNKTWGGMEKMIVEHYGLTQDEADLLLVHERNHGITKMLVDLYRYRQAGDAPVGAVHTKVPARKKGAPTGKVAKGASGTADGLSGNHRLPNGEPDMTPAKVAERRALATKLRAQGVIDNAGLYDIVNLARMPKGLKR